MTEHRISYGRWQRGMTPIRPSRPLYGTTGRCPCGWRGKSNQAPSKGGKRAVEELHDRQTTQENAR